MYLYMLEIASLLAQDAYFIIAGELIMIISCMYTIIILVTTGGDDVHYIEHESHFHGSLDMSLSGSTPIHSL